MMTLTRLRAILELTRFNDWIFESCERGGENFLKVSFRTSEGKQNGRWWLISSHACESEVVQTALKAVLTATEHEVREQFTYCGRTIFAPHLDVNALMELVDAKREQRRD